MDDVSLNGLRSESLIKKRLKHPITAGIKFVQCAC